MVKKKCYLVIFNSSKHYKQRIFVVVNDFILLHSLRISRLLTGSRTDSARSATISGCGYPSIDRPYCWSAKTWINRAIYTEKNQQNTPYSCLRDQVQQWCHVISDTGSSWMKSVSAVLYKWCFTDQFILAKFVGYFVPCVYFQFYVFSMFCGVILTANTCLLSKPLTMLTVR